jgi:hypothetical protein
MQGRTSLSRVGHPRSRTQITPFWRVTPFWRGTGGHVGDHIGGYTRVSQEQG